MSSNRLRLPDLSASTLAISLSPAPNADGRPRYAPTAPWADENDDDQVVVIEFTALAAWWDLRAAAAEIPALIERSQFAGVSTRSEIIKAAARTIGQTISVRNQPIKRRLDSVIRQIITLADRLRCVARTGRIDRLTAVHRSLRKYVEWTQAHLPAMSVDGEQLVRPGTAIFV